MTDENVPLEFLAAQLAKVLDGQREMRGQVGELQAGQRETNERLGKLEAGQQELQVALAATRSDLAIVKNDVSEIRDTQINHGHRLNAIEGRIALIEKHTVLVKA